MRKALIVDDNEQNLYLLQTMLKEQGYDVLSAGNGVEALEQARRIPPDIVISDILMPVMDGFILCREWRKDERLQQIPFVFYTATYTDPQDEELALSLGARCFVVKPQDPEAFVALLRQVINEYEASPPLAPSKPLPEETDCYRLYSEALVRKLEAKMLELEQVNRVLRQEITERKRAEEAAWRSELTYRLLVENTREAVIVLQDGKAKFVNRGIEWSGYTPEEFLSIPILEMIHPEDREAAEQRYLKKIHGDTKPTRYTYRGLDKSGRIHWIEVSSVLIDWEGRPATLNLITDITGRKRAEKEKEELEFHLQQAQKMESVGRLAGGVAHDFNNILSVIVGYTELALEKAGPAGPLYNDLQEIFKAAMRSRDIVRQLLAFARKQTIDPEVLDLNETVEGMLKMLRRLIGEDIDVVWLPDTGLWPVEMDPSQIDQILANLCVNARDAIADVGKVTIETANVAFDQAYCADHAGFVPGDYAMLAVSDDGCGMDRETCANIFEPFFTTKDVGKGTGLGLATVYGIVKQNNGFINVYSEVGKGTTFRIYLPRHGGNAVETRVESPARIQPGRGETVLLVEDEVSILNMTRIILEKQGYTVLTAGTPGEAMNLAAQHGGEIHLLITDVIMPGMNGRDLADRIRESRPEIKCLFMSGYTANVIAHRGVLDKGVHFMQKPFSRNDLATKVREALNEYP